MDLGFVILSSAVIIAAVTMIIVMTIEKGG